MNLPYIPTAKDMDNLRKECGKRPKPKTPKRALPKRAIERLIARWEKDAEICDGMAIASGRLGDGATMSILQKHAGQIRQYITELKQLLK